MDMVKMCYVIVRKRIFGIKRTEFVQDIQKKVFMKEILKKSGCHDNRKAMFAEA